MLLLIKMSETAGQLVLYGTQPTANPSAKLHEGDQFDNIDFQNLNPQDLGKIISSL
jgi:hypothetical protein